MYNEAPKGSFFVLVGVLFSSTLDGLLNTIHKNAPKGRVFVNCVCRSSGENAHRTILLLFVSAEVRPRGRPITLFSGFSAKIPGASPILP